MKTPQQTYPKLAMMLGVPEIYLKREDLHKYGSHKGRSIPLMIKTYAKGGITDFVISSSGNAAIAAAMAISQHNKNNPGRKLALTVFVGLNIDKKKLENLYSSIKYPVTSIKIEQVERPKQEAFQAEKNSPDTIKNLRQSTDDLALEGYISLADDLNKIQKLKAIFIPTSSGTTVQALGQAFSNFENKPQLHIVQTSACHPIAIEFDTNGDAKSSTAGAIVDNVAHRKKQVIEAIKHSNGAGWIVGDEEIKEARKIVRETTGIDISANSALSVAGLKKAIANGFEFTGPVACLVTGA